MGKPLRFFIRWPGCVLTVAALVAVPCVGAFSAGADPPMDLPVSRAWSGGYPVAQLDRLPEGQRLSRVGYLEEREAFAAVWKALKPGEEVPDVDFGRNVVVFTRNVEFYNRTSILKVTLKGDVAGILAMETMSALPSSGETKCPTLRDGRLAVCLLRPAARYSTTPVPVRPAAAAA